MVKSNWRKDIESLESGFCIELDQFGVQSILRNFFWLRQQNWDDVLLNNLAYLVLDHIFKWVIISVPVMVMVVHPNS